MMHDTALAVSHLQHRVQAQVSRSAHGWCICTKDEPRSVSYMCLPRSLAEKNQPDKVPAAGVTTAGGTAAGAATVADEAIALPKEGPGEVGSGGAAPKVVST